ncbi:MAG: 8-amino-7-oxononanoate synthase [Planctomycetaceae bacterium]|nr:8-amino-7-oxononanoate synthase [Planctomycetaceae bacterium]
MSVPVETDAADWLLRELAQLDDDGLRRHRRTVKHLPQGECEVDGRRLVNFASNDYLGLAGDERLREAAMRVIKSVGVGAGASPLITGRTEWHERLEQKIAEFEGDAAALLFPSGYAANVGTVSTLVGREDVIFSDELNHASLIDGCRLSRADVCVYPHADVEFVAEQLHKHRHAPRRLIVTDGVFSMDGDIAPLWELAHLAEQHDAMLLVDEAHGTGVIGDECRGACEACGVDSPRLVRVGTLSKAVGAVGGFVSGSQELVDYLWNRARTNVFSTSLPAAICAAAFEAFTIIQQEPSRRAALQTRIAQLREPLRRVGLVPETEPRTPIIPVIIGEPAQTVEIAKSLEREGLLVAAIRPPTVPVGTSRLRISLSATHTSKSIDQLARAIQKVIASTSTTR